MDNMAQYGCEDVFPEAGHQCNDVLHFNDLASNKEHDTHRYVPKAETQRPIGKVLEGLGVWAPPTTEGKDFQLGCLHLSLGQS